MSESATSPSRRRQTALEFIESFNTWTVDAIMAVRTEDCTHQVLPTSLNRPIMSNAQFSAYFGSIIPHFKNFNATINDIFEDPAANKVMIWAKSTATTEVGPYANEYMLGLYFNEQGDKITRILEFVDSANSVEFFPRLREHVERKGRAEVESSGQSKA